MPSVHWIDTPAQLIALGQALQSAPVIAVDTEQDAYFAHRPKVCVVQVGALDQEWIIDVLALRSFEPLRDVMADPATMKVLHAAENDIALLRRDCSIEIVGLFDTMAAASILGYRRTGLASLLEQHFDIRIEKRYQRSDWRQRPLEKAQIEYAALDVRFLPRLQEFMAAELERRGRADEAASEFARIERAAWQEKPFEPDLYYRIEGARRLDGIGRRILRDLFVLRREIADAEDRAAFRVAGDHTLLLLSRDRPRSAAELARARGLSPRMRKEYGARILDAIHAAVQQAPLEPPARKDAPRDGFQGLSGEQRRLFDALRRWRSARALERDVEPGRVAPNALLLRIVVQMPRDIGGLERAGVEPWRIREYGQEILDVVAGRGRTDASGG